MSAYNIEHFWGDFAKRTIKNLEFIEKNIEEGKVFEVTQQINSLLGLILIPVEAYKKSYRISDKQLLQLSEQDYNTINSLLDKCQIEGRLYSDYRMNNEEEKKGRIDVNNFISHLRNAIAHGGNHGIHFYPVSEGSQISTIIFYDNNRVNGNTEINEFCVKLSVKELRSLVKAISNLYCIFEKRNTCVKEKQQKYNSDIKKLEELLKNGRSDRGKTIFDFH